jgi:hypothetical protein
MVTELRAKKAKIQATEYTEGLRFRPPCTPWLKSSLYIFFFLLTALPAFAKGPVRWNEFPDCLHRGDLLISADVGWKPPALGNLVTPEIGASIDYCLGRSVTVGAGGSFSFFTFDSRRNYDMFAVLRVVWHPDLGVKNLDVYLVIEAGAQHNSAAYPDSTANMPTYFGAAIGVRWFFTPWTAVYAEVVPNLQTYIALNAGLTVRAPLLRRKALSTYSALP